MVGDALEALPKEAKKPTKVIVNRRSLVLLGKGERQLTFSTAITMSGND